MKLSEDLLALLRRPSNAYIATTMPDGSPQMSQTWVDTDGEHVLINTVQGFQKVRNIERDPRVAVSVSDSTNPFRYYAVRGRVVDVTAEGGAEHIEGLAQRYLGGPSSSSPSARTRSTRWGRPGTVRWFDRPQATRYRRQGPSDDRIYGTKRSPRTLTTSRVRDQRGRPRLHCDRL